MSDGSNKVVERDPKTFEILSELTVLQEGFTLPQLNELECVGDFIYANVYQTDRIVRFDGGWGLLGASNTQPVIVARSEAETEEQLTAIRDEIESWLRTREVAI